MMILNLVSDENCIQVLAPDDCDGNNRGLFHPNEHIGHLRKEYAAKLAPIIDELIVTDLLRSVQFDCFLGDGDTTHAAIGYSLYVVVMCINTPELRRHLNNVFIETNPDIKRTHT